MSSDFLRGHRLRLSSPDQYGHFEARPGQTTEWVISLPDEMIRDIEKRLKPKTLSGKTG